METPIAPHILIIGGGIGGLCLAHGLKKNGISFHVYERDASDNQRTQGYRIRIAREGAEALRYLLDDETWRLFELTCGETKLRPIPEIDAITAGVKLPTYTSDTSDTQNTNSGSSSEASKPYTVDRTLFRSILLRGLRDNVTFDKPFRSYTLSPDNTTITANFQDNTSATGTFLIGADGSNSAVRKQLLPDHRIHDTGGRCIYGKTLLNSTTKALVNPEITAGGMLAIRDRTRQHILTVILEPVEFPSRSEIQREGFECPPDYLYWVMSAQPEAIDFLPEEKRSQPEVFLSKAESEEVALRVARDWHPSVRSLVEHQLPGNTAVLTIRSVDAEFEVWEPNARISVLGDAVHLMGPTVGSGAITALRDAACLCEGLIEDGGMSTSEGIGRYEAEMREYAGETVGKSWIGAKSIFGQLSSDEAHVGDMMMANRDGKLK